MKMEVHGRIKAKIEIECANVTNLGLFGYLRKLLLSFSYIYCHCIYLCLYLRDIL
jgi:hypothetical protein